MTSPRVTALFRRLPDPLKRAIRRGLSTSDLLLLLKFYYGEDSVLREKGWLDSEKRGVPVDASGAPIPWYTYSAIDFLEPRLTDDMSVFEYGSGNSTLWYARRVGTVTAVESSETWFEKMRSEAPDNATVVYREGKDAYTRAATEHDDFDLVVVDGDHREDCVAPALESLADGGVVVWDDYHRYEDDDVFDELRAEGFRALPFWGLKALNAHYRCTAVFYRSDNCLGI